MNKTIYDFAIIGAGMAGASLAAELSSHASVIVLEAEDVPGYHATGRSAAFWEECYGGPDIVPLTLASGPYLREKGFLNPRGALYIGRDADRLALDEFYDTFSATGAGIEQLDRSVLSAKVPQLRDDWTGGVWEEACADIDVGALHAHYLSQMKRGGVKIMMRARMANAKWCPDQGKTGHWEVTCHNGQMVRAHTLINAAGAWADDVARACRVAPLGIIPKRRTVAQLRMSPSANPDLPLVLDINGGFYFKPENGRLWLSPHDETPSLPCDAAPEELDVARAIDRFEKAVDWKVEHVERRWAGLRSFAPDRLPIYGRDGVNPQFVWFAGQGGFGIQTAPAAARFCAQLLLGLERDAMTVNIDEQKYSPARFI